MWEGWKITVEMVRTLSANGDNRWPERIVSLSPEGRRQRLGSVVLLEKEVERVIKQKKLIYEDAVNSQIWRLKNSTWYTCGELINS